MACSWHCMYRHLMLLYDLYHHLWHCMCPSCHSYCCDQQVSSLIDDHLIIVRLSCIELTCRASSVIEQPSLPSLTLNVAVCLHRLMNLRLHLTSRLATCGPSRHLSWNSSAAFIIWNRLTDSYLLPFFVLELDTTWHSRQCCIVVIICKIACLFLSILEKT